MLVLAEPLQNVFPFLIQFSRSNMFIHHADAANVQKGQNESAACIRLLMLIYRNVVYGMSLLKDVMKRPSNKK